MWKYIEIEWYGEQVVHASFPLPSDEVADCDPSLDAPAKKFSFVAILCLFVGLQVLHR